MGWKEIAIVAWKAQRIEEQKHACGEEIKRMGILGDVVKKLVTFNIDSKITCGFINGEATMVVDDVEFVLTGTPPYYLPAIKGKCPNCGEMVKSWGISDLKHLGKYLEKFEPCGQHSNFCNKIRRDI